MLNWFSLKLKTYALQKTFLKKGKVSHRLEKNACKTHKGACIQNVKITLELEHKKTTQLKKMSKDLN